MQVYPILFVASFVSGCFWMYFQFAFWRAVKEHHPDTYERMSGPRNLLLDISLWSIWGSFLFLLKGEHHRFPRKSLRIMGSIVFWSLIAFILTFPALFLTPTDLWL